MSDPNISGGGGAALLNELKEKLETADLELVAKILSIGAHGWIGGAWQRNPLLLGYSARHTELWNETSVGAGYTEAASTAVPAGEIHTVKFISFYQAGGASRDTYLYAHNGSNYIEMSVNKPLAPYGLIVLHTNFEMMEGDTLRIQCVALANTKVLYGRLWGTRVDIDQ